MIEMHYQIDLLRDALGLFECSELTPVSYSWNSERLRSLRFSELQLHPRDLFLYRYGPLRPRHEFLYRWLIRFIHMASRTEGMEMTPEEICGALSQGRRSPTRNHWPDSQWPPVSKVFVHELLSFCYPVIQKTPDNKNLEFSHIAYYNMTMERFGLFQGEEIQLQESLSFVAKFCFAELSDAARGRGQTHFEKDRQFLEERQIMHPFYTYAATH